MREFSQFSPHYSIYNFSISLAIVCHLAQIKLDNRIHPKNSKKKTLHAPLNSKSWLTCRRRHSILVIGDVSNFLLAHSSHTYIKESHGVVKQSKSNDGERSLPTCYMLHNNCVYDSARMNENRSNWLLLIPGITVAYMSPHCYTLQRTVDDAWT